MPSTQTLLTLNEAIAEHSRWKRKFREQLENRDLRMLPSEIRLDHKCALGQWIYGEGTKFSNLPDYSNLRQAHAQFHLAATEIIRKFIAGESVADELAPCSQSKYSLSSSAVIVAITDLIKRLP